MIKTVNSLYQMNRKKAWKIYYPEGNGKAKPGFVLHHKDKSLRHSDWQRYIEFRPEDIEMIPRYEHNKVHSKDHSHKSIEKTLMQIEKLLKELKESRIIANIEKQISHLMCKLENHHLIAKIREKTKILDELISCENINNETKNELESQKQLIQSEIDKKVSKFKEAVNEKFAKLKEEQEHHRQKYLENLSKRMMGNTNGFKKR